jgi:hypothetical protein
MLSKYSVLVIHFLTLAMFKLLIFHLLNQPNYCVCGTDLDISLIDIFSDVFAKGDTR